MGRSFLWEVIPGSIWKQVGKCEEEGEFSKDRCDIERLLLWTPGAALGWGCSEKMGGHASELLPMEIQGWGHLLTTPAVRSLVVLVSRGVNAHLLSPDFKRACSGPSIFLWF